MLRITLLTAFIACSSPAFSETFEGLPNLGSCQPLDYGSFSSVPKINWDGENAVVSSLFGDIEGKVKGLRSHDDSFKMSIVYHDKNRKNEVVVFGFGSPVNYRMALVVFDEIPEYGLLISQVHEFVDAVCAVRS